MPIEVRVRNFPNQGGGLITQAAAVAALQAVDADVLITIVLQNNPGVTAGNVISMTIVSVALESLGGPVGSQGTEITLYVSSSDTNAPNVVGLEQNTGKAAIIAAGFVVGVITYEINPAVAIYSITAQGLVAGTAYASGTAFPITISVEGVVVKGHGRGRRH